MHPTKTVLNTNMPSLFAILNAMRVLRSMMIWGMLLATSLALRAQDDVPVDTSQYDPIPLPRMSATLVLGGFHSLPQLTKSDWAAGPIDYTDSLIDITHRGRSALNFGVVLRYRFDSAWSLRGGLVSRKVQFDLNYQRSDTLTDSVNLVANYVAVPLHAVWHPFPQMQHPIGITAGTTVGYNYTIRGQRGTIDWWLDAGIGWDIHTRRDPGGIIIRPEVRYSIGMNDLFRVKTGTYTATVERLSMNGLVFALYIR